MFPRPSSFPPGAAQRASKRLGQPGSRKVRGGRESPTPPIAPNLTQKGDAEMYKVCPRKAVRDPGAGSSQDRTRLPPPAAAEQKAEEV